MINVELVSRISYFITKYDDKNLYIDIMEDNEINEDRKLVDEISKSILDINNLYFVWEEEYCKRTHSVLRELQSSNKIQQRIVKLFPFYRQS